MQNKFIRLVLTDTYVKTGLVVLVCAASAIPLLLHAQQKQRIELRRVKEKKDFAALLPQLRAKQKILEEQGKIIEEPPMAPEAGLEVTGIFISKKGNTALINGEIYRVGDSLDNFVVANITFTAVILRDTTDGNIVRLVYQDIRPKSTPKPQEQHTSPPPSAPVKKSNPIF